MAIKLKSILFEGKVYKNGESPIMIRLTKDRKSTYISLNYTAKPEHWNKQKSHLYSSIPRITSLEKNSYTKEELKGLQTLYKGIEVHPNHNKINNEITKKLGAIQGLIDRHILLDRPLSINAIKETLTSESLGSDLSFIKYADKKVKEELLVGNIRTHKRYKTVIEKLKEFLKDKDLLFADFNHDFLVKYEAYLKNVKKNKTNTIHTNIKTVRAILYKAIKDKLFDQTKNPFFTYSLKEDRKTRKEKLTLAELGSIKTLDLKPDSLLYHSRNCFLFSFYNAGIRIGDLLQLTWNNITQASRLEYKMDKQGHEKSIKLRPEALEIIESYKKGKNKEDFIFPFLPSEACKMDRASLLNLVSSKTTLINKSLKQIGELANIEKKISTHIARHTFSDIARQKNVNIYDISKALGHSSIKQTESYLKSFDEGSLDSAFNKVFEGL